MPYGKMINTVLDPFGLFEGDYSPDVPSPGEVGGDYLSLLSGYSKGMPTLLNVQKEYGPAFTAEQLKTQSQARAGNLADLEALGARGMAAYGGMSPGQTDLLSALTRSATEQVNAGAALDPALAKVASQAVRSSQAARGLGYGPSDALMESTAMTSLGANLRQQRQAFGEQVAGLNQAERSPVFSWLTMSQQTPALLPASQAYDIFNTAYNARAAANIAAANNQAAVDTSY